MRNTSQPTAQRFPTTVQRARIALGTLVAIEASGPSPSDAEAAVEAAFAAIAGVNQRMHPRCADSDLARINNAPLQTPVPVHSSTRALLDLAFQLNTLTEGAFDPCLPSRPGRLTDIEVAETQVICHSPVALDFGGFAKGYAVDCAIGALMSHGCTAAVVNAGGDLRVLGPRAEPIFLRGPSGELRSIALADAALAVSDANSEHRPPEHQGYYARRAGASPLVTHYAAIIARDAVVADALAKCVLLCSKALAERTLSAFGAMETARQ